MNLVESLKKDVWHICTEINDDLFIDDLLPDREVEGIAESIAKWTFPRRFDFGKSKRLGHDELKTTLSNNAMTTNKKRLAKTRQRIKTTLRAMKRKGDTTTVYSVAKASSLDYKTVKNSGLV